MEITGIIVKIVIIRGGINLIDCYSDKFIEYLETHDIEGIRSIPKSDLHNHFVLGGNREYIKEKAGIHIPYFEGVLHSMNDMHEWNEKYIGNRFDCYEMRKLFKMIFLY